MYPILNYRCPSYFKACITNVSKIIKRKSPRNFSYRAIQTYTITKQS